jgi:hypothetical protein
MRTIKMISVALLLLGQVVSYAQKTLYVDNKPQHLSSDYFTTLQAAINVAKNGDVIQIEGSPTSYGSIKIDRKAITLVGAGHHPKNQNGQTVSIDNIEFTDTTKSVTFDGLVLNRINPSRAVALRKMTIRNCQINKSIDLGNAANDWLLTSNVFQENCSISSDRLDNIANLTFANNFFFKPTIGPLGTNQNVRFSNNLFSGSGIGTRTYTFNNFRNVVIENNLFFHIYAFEEIQPFNTIVDNYTTECDLSLGKEFLTKVNPDFVDYDGGAFATEADFRNKNDLTKKAGLYAGDYPFSMTGEPQRLPVIRLLSIDKQSIANGELSFKFKFEANKTKLLSQSPSLYFSSNYMEKFAKVDWKTITEVECFVNTDPGVGKAKKVTLPTPLTDSLNMVNLEVFVSKIAPSDNAHTMFLRCKNENGEWSKLQYFTFFIDRTDISMELKTLPKPNCVEKEATCFIFTLKNKGTKKIEAQDADLIIYNKKYKSSIATKLPELLPNAETTISVCDATKEILEQDSITVLLSNDFFNRFDQNKSNQIVALPKIKTEQLEVLIGDNKGISCYELSDAETKVFITKDTSLVANQYQWTLTTANNSVRNFTDIAQIKLKDLAPGWHTIKAIAINKCYGSSEFYVPDAAPLKGFLKTVSNYNGKDVSCKNAADGVIEATSCGGTGRYAYHWANRPFREDDFSADKLKAGLHTVTIEDARGCLSTASISLTAPEPIALFAARSNYNEQHVSCAGAADGSITITPTGGVGDFKCQWNNAATTSKITGLSKGIYEVTATDINNCSSFLTIPITEPTPIAIAKTSTQPACNTFNGAATGTINITPSGGTGAFTYLWNGGATTQNRTGLGKGTYTVTVTDANGCKSISSTTLTEPPAMGLTVGLTAPSCNVANGALNGAITLNQNGGTGTFTYAWNGGVTTKNRTNLGTGTYAVTATDANGCKISDSYILAEPAAITIAKTSTQPLCNATSGTLNGTINITPSGGTGAFTYLWNNAATSQNRTGLGSGTYSVTITDANGCKTTNATILTEPTAVAIAKTSTQPSCNATSGTLNGTINITLSGGTDAFTYLWNNAATSQNRTGLGAGTYTVTVSDANGCKATNATVLTEPTAMAIAKTSTNPTCNAINATLNGTINVTPSGGTGAYTYYWNGGVTTQNRSGLGGGTYIVTVTDANGCKAINSTTITEPAAIVIPLVAVANCIGNNTGTVSIAGTFLQIKSTATGSFQDEVSYTIKDASNNIVFFWDNLGLAQFALSPTFTLADGTYTMEIEALGQYNDNNVSWDILQGNTAIQSGCIGGTGTGICPIKGTSTSSFSVTNFVTSNYTYLWSNNATIPTLTGLTGGTYSLTATNVNGCTATNSTTIIDNPTPIFSKVVTQISCNAANGNNSNGAIDITVTGGTAPIIYNWAGLFTSVEDRGNLGAGIYSITVSDANGCKVIDVTTLTEPTAISITTSSTTACAGGSTATASASGGTSAYSYLWNTTPSQQTTATATGLVSGTYIVTVSDANGCKSTSSVTVSASSISVTLTRTEITCPEAGNGAITTTVMGGSGALTYLWEDGTTTTQNRSGLDPGTYTVTVTDANGCTGIGTTMMGSPEPISTNGTTVVVNPTCNGATNGSITYTISGGTGALTYLWNDGVTTQNRTGLGAGTYSLTITDANGCQGFLTRTLTAPSAITITPTVIQPTGASNGEISIVVVGGTAAYTYSWNDGVTTQNRTGLAAGTYSVTVTDANACTASSASTLNSAAPCAVTINASSLTTIINGTLGSVPSGGQTGNLTTRVHRNGTTGTATCSSFNYSGLIAPGTYPYNAYTISNPTASAICVDLNFSNPTGGNIHTVVMQSPFVPADINDPTKFVQVSGSSTGGAVGNVLSMGFNIPANSSVVLVLYDVGALTSNFKVTFASPVWVDFHHIPCHGGTKDINITPGGGTAPYTYNWGGGITTQNRTGLTPDTYTVTVTDGSGCSNTKSITVTQPAAPLSVSTATAVVDVTTSTVTATPAGGTVPYSYIWNPNNGTTATITVPNLSNYLLTVTDAYGCTELKSGVSAKVAQINNGEIKAADQNLSPVLFDTAPIGKNDLLLRPNPATTVAYFDFEQPLSMKLTVSISDITGKEVEKLSFDKDSERLLSLEHYSSGVYLIKVVSEDGQKFVKRLIVQKY